MVANAKLLFGRCFAALAAYWAISLLTPSAAWATCGDYLEHGPRSVGMIDSEEADHTADSPAPVHRPCRGPHCRSNSKAPIAPAPLVRMVVEQWAVPSADAALDINRVRHSVTEIELSHAQAEPEPLLDPPRC